MKKSDLFTIIKKEFARFFGDKRMVLTAILPGILIYVMYTAMGSAFSEMHAVEETYVYDINIVSMPQSLATLKDMKEFEINLIEASQMDDIKAELASEETDLLVVFPEGFDEALLTYDPTTSSEAAPNVEIYYNSVNSESSSAYSIMTNILDEMEHSLANKFDICAGDKEYDMASDEDVSGMFVAMILPMLLITFLFTGCVSAASESIAGEKERGTIATLLVTPMKRRDLALGKIFSLSIIGLISGCSSFLGTMLSLPKLMSGSGMEDMKLTYSTTDYLLLLAIILATTLVIVGLISIMSAFAKSVKEAANMSTPLMLIAMVISLTTMMGNAASDWFLYLIPIYNSVQCMSAIFSMDYQIVPIILTIVSNLVYSGVFVVILTKMFSSERIMYTQ